MTDIDKIYPEGWLLYCPTCDTYIKQSDPQNDSRRKSVVVDDESCSDCVQAAQEIMGRLGVPKGELNGNS